jgi:hypothetical protein
MTLFGNHNALGPHGESGFVRRIAMRTDSLHRCQVACSSSHRMHDIVTLAASTLLRLRSSNETRILKSVRTIRDVDALIGTMTTLRKSTGISVGM